MLARSSALAGGLPPAMHSPDLGAQEGAMPLYAYRCLQCGETFEQVEHIAEHDERTHPKCPRCEGEKVVQVFAPFFPQTAKKS